MMEYKSYTAGPIDFDPDEGIFSGTVNGLKDVVHFEGSTAKEIEQAFKDSIDEYLVFCAEKKEKPDKPYSGKILVRTQPELHRKASVRAAAEGVSLSQWISQQIATAP